MFGITCAPELYQKMMEQILSDCEGCLNYIDDIIVYGVSKEEHDRRLNIVLKRLEDYNVLLNKEKCKIGVSKLDFLGHIFSENGISPANDKLDSIKNFREPNTTEEVRSFLGLVNYVGKFIPNLATLTDPLRQLTKKDIYFKWDTSHKQAFKNLKDIMSNNMILGYYDVNDRTQVVADASPVGLGGVLIQFDAQGNSRIISFASKSLSDVEKRYAQTEKEALALVWVVERFHFYLFGREFELITDHKPLETIFGTKSKPCARIERWVLRLQSYKFNVVYKSGKTNIADPLSRLIMETTGQTTFDEYSEHYVNWIVSNAAPKAISLDEIEEQSKNDESFKCVKKAIFQNDWSDVCSSFKTFATELCFSGEILLRGTRIVVPQSLQNQIMELAHEGHPGMSVMKRRLRAKVWWPKMDSHIEAFVRNCFGCTLVSAPPAPEPMKRTELPNAPWEHLAIDFCGPLPSGHYLFIVVDYYSRFFEVEIMTKTNSTQTIKNLKKIFARFGIPLSITADNGRQLVSEEFKQFCEEYNIKLITTIPYWPQQNGEVERQNRSLLKRLSISQSTNRNWQDDLLDYLLMYRTTPHSTTLETPSKMMFGRTIRDKIPTIQEPLKIEEGVRDRDAEKKLKEKVYGDEKRQAKESDIKEGDEVLIKRANKTNKLQSTFDPDVHKVIERKGAEILVQSNSSKKHYRRNVAHAKKNSTSVIDNDTNVIPTSEQTN